MEFCLILVIVELVSFQIDHQNLNLKLRWKSQTWDCFQFLMKLKIKIICLSVQTLLFAPNSVILASSDGILLGNSLASSGGILIENSAPNSDEIKLMSFQLPARELDIQGESLSFDGNPNRASRARAGHPERELGINGKFQSSIQW